MASDGAARGRPPKLPATEGLDPANVLTYKRRRRSAGSSDSPSAVPSPPGPVKNKMSSAVVLAVSSQQGGRQTLDRHWRSWRDMLEGVLQSTAVNQGGAGGIQSCIRDALRYYGCQPTEHGNLADGRGAGGEDPAGAVHSEENSAALVQLEDGTAASLEANKAMCHKALFDILISDKFAMLCHLLAVIFHVNKPDDVIGLQIIDAKMRNGDYAQEPALLDHDIKQIWKKFEHVGQQMAGLASSLSVISQASHQKQASDVSEIDVSEHRIEETSLIGGAHKALRELTPTCDSGHSTIPKGSGTSGSDGICKDCGGKADSKGRIICDRCEAAYHVSCLKLAIDEEAQAKWYCPSCVGLDGPSKNNNNGRSHEGCDVCEWLIFEKPEEPTEDVSQPELAVKTQGSSVSGMDEDSEPDLSTTALANLCKHCGTCEDENKKFLVCGHPYCSFKFYHVLCMKESQIATEKQKNIACWYCPSCLCRRCFKNKDDEEIVLCDGCDDAYHIYCMTPPLDCVPRGSWYCLSCKAQRSARGMQRYEESILQKAKKSVPDAKRGKAHVAASQN